MHTDSSSALPNQLLAEAEIAFKGNQFSKVIELLKKDNQPAARSLELIGYSYAQLGNLKETEKYLLAASKKIDCATEVFYYLGRLYLELNKASQAINYLKIAVAKYTNFYEAHYLLGTAYTQNQQLEKAIKHYLEASKLNSQSADLMFNLGNTYFELGEVDKAIDYYDKSLTINPWHLYTLLNFGVLESHRGNHQNALVYFRKIENIPNLPKLTLADLYSNIGSSYNEIGNYLEAENYFKRSLALNPVLSETYNNLGSLYYQQKNYEQANSYFQKAYELNPNQDYVIGKYAVSSQLIGKWSNLKELTKKIEERVLLKKNCIDPLEFLYLCDHPKLHFECVKSFVKKKLCLKEVPFPPLKPKKVERIKIAYVSPDFKNHAVTNLTAELFELHDRQTFEVIGISIKKHNQNDQMRNRVINAFETFHDLDESLSDQGLLEYCRNLEIDIAIDLGGHTLNSRPVIFKNRVAPIQMSYLGFLGTLGFESMDYLITDKTVIPETSSKYFYEKMIYLPECFQVNDSKRPQPSKTMDKKEFGLPEEGFVFTCFNNRVKITPKMFHAWLKILKRTENTFLWILSESEESDERLRNLVKKENINPQRIIFTKKLPFETYLAAYLSADVFLDTYPHNGGTTTSDALWMGLPVITLCGQSMASRMGASLLKNIGLEDLVTENLEDYIELAISLASTPTKYKSYQSQLAENRLNCALFNTPKTVKYLELAFQEAMSLHKNGDAPRKIEVPRMV